MSLDRKNTRKTKSLLNMDSGYLRKNNSAKSRYEVVDTMVRKWLLRYGGDPSQYKKQTRAFDALAALADRIIRQHVETLEGVVQDSKQVMDSLEEALKDVTEPKEPLHARLGPALAALLHTADIADLETEETMTSLVNSLINEEHPITTESIERIEIFNIMEDIRDCGVQIPSHELENIIKLAIDCLRAQIVGAEEAKVLEKEVEKAMSIDMSSVSTPHSTTTPDKSHHEDEGEDYGSD